MLRITQILYYKRWHSVTFPSEYFSSDSWGASAGWSRWRQLVTCWPDPSSLEQGSLLEQSPLYLHHHHHQRPQHIWNIEKQTFKVVHALIIKNLIENGGSRFSKPSKGGLLQLVTNLRNMPFSLSVKSFSSTSHNQVTTLWLSWKPP